MTLNETLGWSGTGMKERGKREYPRENPPASGIVQHDSHLRKSLSEPAGIESGSLRWEGSALATAPPLPHHFVDRHVGLRKQTPNPASPELSRFGTGLENLENRQLSVMLRTAREIREMSGNFKQRKAAFHEDIYAVARLHYPMSTLAVFIWLLAACLGVKADCYMRWRSWGRGGVAERIASSPPTRANRLHFIFIGSQDLDVKSSTNTSVPLSTRITTLKPTTILATAFACGQHAIRIKRGEVMEQRRNARARKMRYPRENPPTSGIVQDGSHVRKSGGDLAGNRTRWEASSLTTARPRPTTARLRPYGGLTHLDSPFPHQAYYLTAPSPGGRERLTSQPLVPPPPPFADETGDLDKIDFKRVYTEDTFAIGSKFIRHALDESTPIADLQRNKKLIPQCQMWGNTGATANDQTSEVRLHKELWSLAYMLLWQQARLHSPLYARDTIVCLLVAAVKRDLRIGLFKAHSRYSSLLITGSQLNGACTNKCYPITAAAENNTRSSSETDLLTSSQCDNRAEHLPRRRHRGANPRPSDYRYHVAFDASALSSSCFGGSVRFDTATLFSNQYSMMSQLQHEFALDEADQTKEPWFKHQLTRASDHSTVYDQHKSGTGGQNCRKTPPRRVCRNVYLRDLDTEHRRSKHARRNPAPMNARTTIVCPCHGLYSQKGSEFTIVQQPMEKRRRV
ncbi:hypothetical protein PR048_026170 [Dryococelus australis]|uniref:Uncharacterized protein n=1 Tax=Dryococelus australis TaxID=614101 RepID=A0ABQ9GKN2_9NEOP|nr:hypothetical protein PR048_026170 [Dryococelus australis]